MMKRLTIALLALLTLTNCAPSASSSGYNAAWDGGMAYVNPTVKPSWGAMKTLEQPGIY